MSEHQNLEKMIEMVEWLDIIPLLILTGSILLIMMVIAIWRNHLLTNVLTLAALLAAVFSIAYIPSGIHQIGSLITVDSFGLWIIGLILFATFFITLISYNYLEKQHDNQEEYYLLLLTGALGSSVLAVATHFVSFFLGLELLSVSIYILASYVRSSEKGMEAAIKYLVLAGVSSAFLLMGMAMLYGKAGTMEFNELAVIFSERMVYQPLVLAGLAFMIVGIGFKLAVVPFHLWTPDVYEGAPSPTSAFIASVSKGAIVALLIRFFMIWEGEYFQALILTFSIIAILSMLAGNLLALRQRNVKRILAYSSIAHMGYILVAFIAADSQGAEAVSFYLIAYFITIIAAFGVVSLVSEGKNEDYGLEAYQGLFWQRPWLATTFTTMLLSLAGLPLTAGFIGKFYVLLAGMHNSLWFLLLTLVVGSVIGLYYYLKIIVEMFKQPDSNFVTSPSQASLSTHIALIVLTVLVIWLGVSPGEIADFIKVVTDSSF